MVYVDNALIPFKRGFRTYLMCHMVADSLEELHDMADRIGVNRRHFQSHTRYCHYDICKTKQTKATELGAVVLSRKELLLKAKALTLHVQQSQIRSEECSQIMN